MNKDQLLAIMPAAKSKAGTFCDPLNLAMGGFGITTPLRQAAFLAQIGHESGSLNFIQENLNYSSERLVVIFKKYFPTPALADIYARNPERIANRVYANRGGNGNEASGDGWRFRGAGLIQLTFKDNQSRCAEYFNIPLSEIGDWLRTVDGACRSAAWFWKINGLNELADKEDFLTITKRINGGINGLDDRSQFYARAKKVLL